VIGMSTSRPALAIRRPELGHLGVGAPADITVLKQVDSDYVFEDVTGAKRQGTTLLQPVAVYLEGRQMELARRPFEEPFIAGCGHDHHH
jgi:dihydroorotase